MSELRIRALAASVLLLIHATASLANESFRAVGFREVHFIYLVPSDRSASSVYPDRIAFAAGHFRYWLAENLEGRTFRLADPAVRVVKSDKPAKWFSSSERHAGFSAFYRNAVDELVRLGSAKHNDPFARYIVYVDADHACGQSGAGGNGVAVMSANDLRGISGEKIVAACEKPNAAEVVGQCRWIGGMGHELLHTLGLLHPDRSPACQSSQCRSEALMMQGYMAYPQAILLEEERSKLRQSPFIQAQRTNRALDCAKP